MNLEHLPDEVLIIIIKQLNGDLKSLYRLYSACERVRNVICTYGVIKTYNLTLSDISPSTTVTSSFFMDISMNLKELNMRGVCNLNKTILLPVFRRLHCLHKLDVTYTNITIFNFVEIYNLCPTIKDISINFILSNQKLDEKSEKTKLRACQKVFKRLSNVHFIGNLSCMMYSELPNFILCDALLNTLQYTINKFEIQNIELHSTSMLNFKKLTINFLNTKIPDLSVAGNNPYLRYGPLDQMPAFEMMDIPNYEIIIIIRKNYLVKPVCYASPIFTNLFSYYRKYGMITFNILNDFNIEIQGNSCVMLWKKDSTKFDEKFFLDLQCKLKPFFIYYFPSTINTPVPPDFFLYMTNPVPEEIDCDDSHRVDFKRTRIVAPSCVLDYDTAFQSNKKLRLCINFNNESHSSVTLPSSCEYLKKLTYVSLSGRIRYNSDFFNVLFKNCCNLTTLLIDAPSISPCSLALARSLPLSNCIKNILLIDKRIDFQMLYSSMSQCRSLENIHIMEKSNEGKDLSNPATMFVKCVNLYCLHIYGSFSEACRKRLIPTPRRGVCESERRVNVKVINSKYFICDPYIEVFNLNSIISY